MLLLSRCNLPWKRDEHEENVRQAESAGYFDGNNEISAVLEKMMGIERKNTSLIGLSNVRKHRIDHS